MTRVFNILQNLFVETLQIVSKKTYSSWKRPKSIPWHMSSINHSEADVGLPKHPRWSAL